MDLENQAQPETWDAFFDSGSIRGIAFYAGWWPRCMPTGTAFLPNQFVGKTPTLSSTQINR